MGKPKLDAPLIGVKVSPEMRAQIDAAIRSHRKRTGDNYNISRFIRDAVQEKLDRDALKRPAKVAPSLQATGT
jgi:hypothetical protein